MRAAEMFTRGASAAEVAADLRVSERSAYRWRQSWAREGRAGLASKGHGGAQCVLSAEQVRQLGRTDRGPGRTVSSQR
jgi:transposase